jgi:hypothetical protein
MMCDDHYEGGNDWTDVYRGTGIESAGRGRIQISIGSRHGECLTTFKIFEKF